ncbi:MAG TPA: tRNA glutamyl-Q(34) synthetase GluQRS [Azonexus sp.]|nr:tRNA glutamyl-Q(34) synthetase GluQRS [Azonexus sp.]
MFVTGALLYRGRFAPSPTGPLHFGSLIAALASCLEARCRGGEWLLRIEDVDTPRNVPGAADAILRTLEAFGFVWDGPLLYQSRRVAAYEAALDVLRGQGLLYPCACSRSEIAAAASRTAVDGGAVYPGTCRDGLRPGAEARAWRLRVDDAVVVFEDRLQGIVEQRLAEQVGDFVLRRADGIHAYQLAVVVDDASQGITDIVRGADLLASTPRQLWLQQCLGYPRPGYAHLPVATNPAGEKWSKQTLAPALAAGKAAAELVRALRFLGQPAPAELAAAPVAEVWDWALANWSFATIPRVPAISVPATAA